MTSEGWVDIGVPGANIYKYGIDLLKFRECVLWNQRLANLKECQSLLKSKLLLKQSGSLPYTCSVCRS